MSDLQEYSKIGRVNWSLSRRQDLLNQVQRLASSLNIVGDVGYSCETAEYFAQEHIQTRIKRYNIELQQLKDTENTNSIESIFPFKQYFPALNFTGTCIYLRISVLNPVGDIHHDELVANDSIESIQNMFVELTEYRSSIPSYMFLKLYL